MLIPGNKLGITSKEWARLGVPLGLVLMALFFAWIFCIPIHVEFSL
jgi:predicted cation transporter